MSENLELKSISELLEKDFYIPAYQRGYRWDSRQVKDLLEDILEFSKDGKGGFYCLQPIVVKTEIIDKKINRLQYRVIDGQQRLTTIFIILKYLEELLFEEHAVEKIYNISYETREKSKEFLEKINIDSDISHTENIDFYNMKNTYTVTKEWFQHVIKTKKITKRKFLEILMGADQKDVKFIWYEIDNNEYEVDIFTRLNIGKIPLTNAELIKALFVLNTGEDNEKLKLTTEWDNIEYTLQDSKFFAFLNDSEYTKATKIEFIFDLIADIRKTEIDIENLKDDDDKHSFYTFNYLISNEEQKKELWKNLTNEERAKVLWKDVKKYFRIFNELYNSNTYYHLVGYLTNTDNGKSIKDIIKLFTENTKDDFELALKNAIKTNISKKKDRALSDLNYNDDKREINRILFLFNVVSTLNSRYTKYPFDRHKLEKWSLEHIHAQNSEQIKKDIHKKALLESELDYIKDETLIKEIKSLLQKFEDDKKIDSDFFNELQDKIFNSKEYGDGSSIYIHTINNLALLSKDDNSALNNSVFPAKRDKIKELDSFGSFIPIGTKNVFLKYYSNDVTEAIQWNQEDMDCYLEEIKSVLKEYLGDSNE